MAVEKIDEYKHGNPKKAFVDSDFLRGGGKATASLVTLLTDFVGYEDQLKDNVTLVWVISESKMYRLKDKTQIGSLANGWAELTSEFQDYYNSVVGEYFRVQVGNHESSGSATRITSSLMTQSEIQDYIYNADTSSVERKLTTSTINDKIISAAGVTIVDETSSSTGKTINVTDGTNTTNVAISPTDGVTVTGDLKLPSVTAGTAVKLLGRDASNNVILTDVDAELALKADQSDLETLDSRVDVLETHYKGVFVSLVALQTAHPTATAGDYANIDEGVGSDITRYVWDGNDNSWVQGGGGGAVESVNGQVGIVTLNTSHISDTADKRYLLDAERTKLTGIATGATANDTDANLKNRANHTGTQLASTISDFLNTVLGSTLIGYVKSATSRALSTGDSILTAFGLLERRIDDTDASVDLLDDRVSDIETTVAVKDPLGVRWTDDFARVSVGASYTQGGSVATWVADGSKMVITAGSFAMTEYLKRNDYKTNAEEFTNEFKFVLKAYTSSSYGIGHRIFSSTNGGYAGAGFGYIFHCNTAAADAGKIRIYNVGTSTVVAESVNKIALAVDDVISCKIVSIRNVFQILVTNETTGRAISLAYTFPLIYPAIRQTPNSIEFAIQTYGGTYHVTEWTHTCDTIVNADYMTVGDSMSAGYFGGSTDDRFTNVLASMDRTKTGVVYARQGIVTQDIVDNLPEIVALSPKRVFLLIGYNDLSKGYTQESILTNLTTIKTTLEADGIEVIFLSIIKNVTLNAAIVSTFATSNRFIDVNTSITSNGTTYQAVYDSGDTIHPSKLANQVIARIIYAQCRDIFPITLPTIVNDGRVSNQGDAYNADITIGTRDAYAVKEMTNNTVRGQITSDGKRRVGDSTTPTATLHLKAGTATVGGAPLKLDAGTNLTTVENGALEFDGTNLYFTVAGVRKIVTLT